MSKHIKTDPFRVLTNSIQRLASELKRKAPKTSRANFNELVDELIEKAFRDGYKKGLGYGATRGARRVRDGEKTLTRIIRHNRTGTRRKVSVRIK